MKNISKLPRLTPQALLALVALQFPVVGYCDSGNSWFKNLFESKGKNMKELVVTREVIIPNDETAYPLVPNVIVRANDGGFIIAGGRLLQAGAIKTDPAGKVLWRYVTDLRDKLYFGQGVKFQGAVAMPDGTTYLCGNIPATANYVPSLLTHLDAAGRLLDEQHVMPQKVTEYGVSHFYDCIRWGDGIAMVGNVHNVIRQAGRGVEGISESYYWTIVLDASGKVQWEKQIPTAFDTIDRVKSLLVAPDSSLVFAGQRSYGTELFRVSMAGEVTAKKSLVGVFQFVRPIVPDGMLQVHGFAEPKGDDTLFATITLSDQLKEIQRVQGKQASNLSDKLAYRMPDQSLVLFGTVSHSVKGDKSAIAHVDPTLQSAQKLELIHAPLMDNFSIDAATPTGNDGEFVTARMVMSRSVPSAELTANLVLDFIQTK